MSAAARLAVDIGGTFTDLAVEAGGRWTTAKVLTTPSAPERGVFEGVRLVLERARLEPADVRIIVHGTTLATNALIERKGARTALLVTEGFRDSVEMAYENRFEQFDVMMDKPPPLVPRHLRLPVPERMDARGNVVRPLDASAIGGLVDTLRRERIESVAVGFLHAYVNPAHELAMRELLRAAAPELAVTLSSDVAPEIREYERWSTACANAYVQPVMAGYLGRLGEGLRAAGLACPLFLITSAGGLTTLETARRFPIRLVESGPAGGAVLAAHIAGRCGLDRIVSFDMGGTTAKICLIDDGKPHFSRTFEVARQYRFLKGSGLPLKIPVIEMVEIGAGGGSIAAIDEIGRVQVGPESAGSEPGPACYGRGGTQPTVTDANVVLGRIDPEQFGGGTMPLDAAKAERALDAAVGAALAVDPARAALAVSEIVEENMANAARVHAVERGRHLGERTMIAFGGAAPLHAVRLADKLGIARIIVPSGAGVGSAIGFLLAPVAFEVVKSRYVRLDDSFDAAALNAMRAEMRREALAIVRQGAPDAALQEHWSADMRYSGQGHEVPVTIDAADFTAADGSELARRFGEAYAALFGRTIPGLAAEALNWSLRLEAAAEDPTPAAPAPPTPAAAAAVPSGRRRLTNPETGQIVEVALYARAALEPGQSLSGPAVITEDETTTIVQQGFTATIDALKQIVIVKEAA